eukprot:3041_1
MAPIASAQSAASQRHGYNEAINLYNTNRYSCNLPGTLKFWNDVKNQTFKECDRKYFLNQQRIESCKEGAATFVREKADSCATEKDCQGLGTIAAKKIPEQFCRIVAKAKQSTEFFPPVCQKAANRQCNIDGKLGIQSLANKNQCGNVKLPLTEAQNLALQSECREYVRDWSRQSLLP